MAPLAALLQQVGQPQLVRYEWRGRRLLAGRGPPGRSLVDVVLYVGVDGVTIERHPGGTP